ncbi:hypothetical protein XANCAGTX0491_002625 [Xanthoria calcicola]
MPKRSIADFFKPFAFARHDPSPPIDLEAENPKPSQRSRSCTPQSQVPPGAEQAETSNPATILPEASSQSSILSSLCASTPNAPEDLLTGPVKLPIVPSANSASDQSFGADFGGSQATIIPSSQRIIRNGQVVIKDSDDERSDSEVSLEDLDDLIAARKPSLISSPSSQNELSSHQPAASRPTTNIRAAETKLPAYKFSLDALIKQSQNHESSRESIQDARRLLESFEEQKPVGIATSNTGLDKDLLASVIRKTDDETDMGRLMGAIERTEALHQAETWSFFDGDVETVELEPLEFPSLTDQYWRSVLEDPLTRHQAFLSGFVGDCASFRRLPDDLLAWLLNAACCEERNDLRFSYCQTLRSLDYQIAHCLTTGGFNQVLERLGARSDALDFDKPATPSASMSKSSPASTQRLRYILDMYLATSSSMSPPLRKYTMAILSRLLLDRETFIDHNLLHMIQDIMSRVIDRIEGNNGDEEMTNILTIIYHSVQDPGLQLQLLRNLPSSNTQQSLLRRRLALAFFSHDPAYLSKDRQMPIDMKALTGYLRQPRFVVNNETDYPGLAAAVAILAIGLDNGDPPPGDASKEAITAFNNDLDMLAQRIKGMFTQIVDTGASHMRRTEAKEVLESFHSCLVFAVRTRQKPKGMMWEDSIGTEKQKGMMKDFVKRDMSMDKSDMNGVR